MEESGGGGFVCLTGAGISAESGLRTFRADDGLWEDHPVEQVATPGGFAADPALVHRFYNARRAGCAAVKPNAAHVALAGFQRAWPGDFLLVTQNIDDLHERAGSAGVLHMHGEVKKARCLACRAVTDSPAAMGPGTPCPSCDGGRLRPHVVWFGETPLRMGEIEAALARCSTFVAVGTSGTVYPAAGFVAEAATAGARCIEVNAERTGSPLFAERRIGKASETLPALLDELLGQAGR